MANGPGGPSEQRVRPLRIVRPSDVPAVARESMTLSQIYRAAEGAGSEPTGVYAVWAEGRGERVIDAEGRYVGPAAVTTPWPLRGAAPLDNERLPQSVYDAFKAARGGMDLEQALAHVYSLGRESAAA